MATHVGFKATLSVNDGVSQAHAVFANMVECTLPERVVEAADVTPMAQSDFYKQYIPALQIDPGILKLTLFFTKANYDRVSALLGKKYIPTTTTETEWKLSTPDPDGAGAIQGKICTAKGFVTKIGEAKFDKSADATKFDVEVRLTGAWTISDLTNES